MFGRGRRERRHPDVTPEAALRDHVVRGHTLLEQGRATEAEQLLAGALPLVTEVGPHTNGFLAYRLLGQCARTSGRLDAARGYYSAALDVAEALGDPHLAGAAVSGMAFVELAASDLERADGYFRQAVQLVRTVPPGPGRVTVLRNYADLLARADDPRAAGYYQEALDQPGVAPADRATMLLSLGRELCRRGRVEPGVERLRAAAALLREAESPSDEYTAVVALAGAARDCDPPTAADAFVRAHDLARSRSVAPDPQHYTEGYAARVRAVEAETQRRAAAGQLPTTAHPAFRAAAEAVTQGLRPDVASVVAVGAPATVGMRSLEEAEALLAEYRLADADAKLQLADVMWSSLGAAHVLPRVWAGQGRLALLRGDDAAAWGLLERARTQAAALGDARTELVAIVGQCRLAAELAVLELVPRARALAELGGADSVTLTELAAAAAEVCRRYGADALTEQYLREAVGSAEAGRHLAVAGLAPPGAAAALAEALAALVRFLVDADRGAEVAPLRERLVALGSSDDPVVRLAAQGTLGRLDLVDGTVTESTAATLADACAAADELRARGAGSLPTMPYADAAEASVVLGRPDEALALLERADGSGSGRGGATLVVAFAGVRSIHLLTAAPDVPVVAEAIALEEWAPGSAVDRKLREVLDGLAGPVRLVAPGSLPSARFASADVSVLPELLDGPGSAAAGGPGAPAGRGPGWVFADPLGDQPFARVAAAHAARTLGTTPICGPAVTADRLAGALAGTPLLHLAVPVVTDPRRPRRSGLLLAGPDGSPDRLAPPRLATLPWAGVTVLLAPGDRAAVPAPIVATLLRAGATAVVASTRPVDALTGAVLTTWLADALADGADVYTAVHAAQECARTSSGDDLLAWAAERPDLDAAALAVVTERAESRAPFADPGHWAWLTAYGLR
ncbi:tetratricopeptide repeat protein [Cryptosporangium phraense]|uniref:Tetratricopeptide repeat protein n=1 Tax=Cryptosporangium phraense TaxID=2593070 RepID=A0A545B023_9ACTN|nr:tetratricopeptide repeat protein [Cryptosporangium phraense]TQS46927.1 tetratricopeptide repeat protein [Cryptosporangium phraense]